MSMEVNFGFLAGAIDPARGPVLLRISELAKLLRLDAMPQSLVAAGKAM
jgi:hypothetical protein